MRLFIAGLAVGLLILIINALIGLDVRLDALESTSSTLAQATGTPQPLDILVGQGCLGATGPNRVIVGLDESEMPECEAIDVHTVMVMP